MLLQFLESHRKFREQIRISPEQIQQLIREQSPYVFDWMFGAAETVRE